jgi:glutamate--cysteine ligase
MMSLLCTRTNWNRVILEGRKPGLTLGIGCETAQFPLQKVGKDLFHDLKRVAQTMDSVYGGDAYQQVCDELVESFDNPELTFSARILRSMLDQGIGGTGRSLSAQYREMLQSEPLEVISEADFDAEREASQMRQKEIEAADTETFAAFLAKNS